MDKNLFIQKTCVICLEDLSDKNRKDKVAPEVKEVFLECGHNFHFNCIEEWGKTKNSCPICRTKIVVNENRPNKVPLIRRENNVNLIENNLPDFLFMV